MDARTAARSLRTSVGLSLTLPSAPLPMGTGRLGTGRQPQQPVLHTGLAPWQEHWGNQRASPRATYPQSLGNRKCWISSASGGSREAVANLFQASTTNLNEPHTACRIQCHPRTSSPTLLPELEWKRKGRRQDLRAPAHAPPFACCRGV